MGDLLKVSSGAYSEDKILGKSLCWLLRTIVCLGCTLVTMDSTLYGSDVTL